MGANFLSKGTKLLHTNTYSKWNKVKFTESVEFILKYYLIIDNRHMSEFQRDITDYVYKANRKINITKQSFTSYSTIWIENTFRGWSPEK